MGGFPLSCFTLIIHFKLSTISIPAGRGGKRKGSAEGERNRDRKRRAGLKGRWGGEPVWGLLGGGGRCPAAVAPPPGTPPHLRALPFPTWSRAVGSPSREASPPGACILDSLSFTPLRLPCSPQALQSLGRLSSRPASKEPSAASKGRKATCNGP